MLRLPSKQCRALTISTVALNPCNKYQLTNLTTDLYQRLRRSDCRESNIRTNCLFTCPSLSAFKHAPSDTSFATTWRYVSNFFASTIHVLTTFQTFLQQLEYVNKFRNYNPMLAAIVWLYLAISSVRSLVATIASIRALRRPEDKRYGLLR